MDHNDVIIKYPGGRFTVRNACNEVRDGQSGTSVHFQEGRGEIKSVFIPSDKRLVFENIGGNAEFIAENVDMSGLEVLLAGRAQLRDDVEIIGSTFDNLTVALGEGEDSVLLENSTVPKLRVFGNGEDVVTINNSRCSVKLIPEPTTSSADQSTNAAPLNAEYVALTQHIDTFRASLVEKARSARCSNGPNEHTREAFQNSLNMCTSRLEGRLGVDGWRSIKCHSTYSQHQDSYVNDVERAFESLLASIDSPLMQIADVDKRQLRVNLNLAIVEAAVALNSNESPKTNISCPPQSTPNREVRVQSPQHSRVEQGPAAAQAQQYTQPSGSGSGLANLLEGFSGNDGEYARRSEMQRTFDRYSGGTVFAPSTTPFSGAVQDEKMHNFFKYGDPEPDSWDRTRYHIDEGGNTVRRGLDVFRGIFDTKKKPDKKDK